MWSFRIVVLLVSVQNLSFMKAEVADVERRSADRHRRQSANDKPTWTYDEVEDGQRFWDEIGYDECGGKSQSPMYLNINGLSKKYEYLKYNDYNELYQVKLTNTGRTLKLALFDEDNNFNEGYCPYLTGGDLGPGRYNFTELIFHFGTSNQDGSEHKYQLSDNKPPTLVLEMQLIHKDEYGNIVIVVQLFEIGRYALGELDDIIESTDKVKYQGESTIMEVTLFDVIQPTYFQYVRYNGSLTYPPCTEGVVWLFYGLYGPKATVSYEQMKKLRTLMSTKRNSNNPQPLAPNFRKLQKVYGRKVFFQQL